MIPKLAPLLCSLFFCAASLAPLTAQAQEERWYKVELLIFSRAQFDSEETESWDPTPTLRYPSSFRFLLDPTRKVEPHAAADPNAPHPNEPNTIAMAPPTSPTPFTVLSELEDRVFTAKAQQMERSSQYSVLFHQSWIQPMPSKADAIDIVLDHSGDEQRWPKLQGSMKFYLSRYLHVETNIWLNTTGNYLTQGWQMPAPPLGPASQVIHTLDLEPNEAGANKIAGLDDSVEPLVALAEPILSAVPDEPVIAPTYPWRHALLLQQKRRMRSTEVHYIDHPAMGVVVLVTPVSEEELLLRAEREAAQSL